MTSDRAKQLEQARQTHIGRALHQAARLFNTQALELLHARGHTRLSMAHTYVLPHLDLAGTTIVTVAERAGITKQAAGQLIAQLEAAGYVERRADPRDKRASRISFTEQGWVYLQDAQEVKQEIEVAYRQALGTEGLHALQRALEALLEQAIPLEDRVPMT